MAELDELAIFQRPLDEIESGLSGADMDDSDMGSQSETSSKPRRRRRKKKGSSDEDPEFVVSVCLWNYID